ncbi:hypothetical protein ZIOFF_009851 [Zingiber officinale]|uniref:Mediator of RNA polymerase II transcription subunit 25 n=1 Tax=Zingiber officinale TaxID=94328 RepID=A0A8J5I470_ZINOF|nr:hypothetical protein ZIOFF_009851 [Zingiber officinale]
MAEKQLIVVVEGTAALGPYWQTIRNDYLEKIIRCYYGNELTGQKLNGTNPEFALVVFNTHGPYNVKDQTNSIVTQHSLFDDDHPFLDDLFIFHFAMSRPNMTEYGLHYLYANSHMEGVCIPTAVAQLYYYGQIHGSNINLVSNISLAIPIMPVFIWSSGYIVVQRSGWTKDLDIFLQWLSTMCFSGGGFSEAAIAEGLSEALMVSDELTDSFHTSI